MSHLSGLASAFFSPSKAAEQQAIADEWSRVEAWLERIYGPDGPPVKDWERTPAVLTAFQNLMSVNERANKDVAVTLAVIEEAAGIPAPGAEPAKEPPAPPEPAAPTAAGSHTAVLLSSTYDALPPAYKAQLSALGALAANLGLPIHPLPENVSSLNDVGALDFESIAWAIASHDFYASSATNADAADASSAAVVGNVAFDPVAVPLTTVNAAAVESSFQRRREAIQQLRADVQALIGLDLPLDSTPESGHQGVVDYDYVAERPKPLDLDRIHADTIELSRQSGLTKKKIDDTEAIASRKQGRSTDRLLERIERLMNDGPAQ